MTKAKRDIYQEVTDRIIDGLEAAGGWSKPWACLGTNIPQNAVSGRRYNGINVLLLALQTQYSAQEWLTYKQARDLGGNVRKGEKGTGIVFFKPIDRTTTNEATGEEERSSYAVIRSFTVFNVEQCDGLNRADFVTYVPPVRASSGAIEIAEACGADVHYGGDRACFIPSRDEIHMPSVEAFNTFADHESTLLHELTHWTGHTSRLDRLKVFGNQRDYAAEELVAEIGSAMACAELGIDYTGLQHVEYIASWLKALRNDKRHVFTAARLAQKAVDLIRERALAGITQEAAA